MRALFLIICLSLMNGVLFCQSTTNLFNPLVDNARAFIEGDYDKSLIKRSKVESAQVGSRKFYFDTSGFIQKAIYLNNAGKPEHEFHFQFNAQGDLVAVEGNNFLTNKPFKGFRHKEYEHGKLIKDSSSPVPICFDYSYDTKGNLQRIVWRAADVGNSRVMVFRLDSSGKAYKITDRQYTGIEDTIGELISDRKLFYDKRGRVIKEEESKTFDTEKSGTKVLVIGSTEYKYDKAGNLVEISREKGYAQKIIHNEKGLIKEIVTTAKYLDGSKKEWKWVYSYTYRN